MPQTILTIKEVAETLRITTSRAYELVRDGRLPCLRLGKQVRVRAQDLDEFIQSGGFQLPGGWRRERVDFP